MLDGLFRLQALLATTTVTGVADAEPGMLVVVVTGITLVFAILVLLWLALLLSGKLFASLDGKKKQKEDDSKAQAASNAAPPPVSAPVAPVVEDGIPPEVVAAIAAAVANIDGGKYTLRAVQTSQKGRGQWGLAGVIESTEPF